jgi:hypothetical protein
MDPKRMGVHTAKLSVPLRTTNTHRFEVELKALKPGERKR